MIGHANTQIHFFPIAFLTSRFFRSVRNKEKQIINYRYYKDFTQSETARILGMSQVTVSRYEKKSLTKMYNYLSI